jgi:hypothetical protein
MKILLSKILDPWERLCYNAENRIIWYIAEVYRPALKMCWAFLFNN